MAALPASRRSVAESPARSSSQAWATQALGRPCSAAKLSQSVTLCDPKHMAASFPVKRPSATTSPNGPGTTIGPWPLAVTTSDPASAARPAPVASGAVVSALDNLVKGAAGQALQNANLMVGFDEALGLPQ